MEVGVVSETPNAMISGSRLTRDDLVSQSVALAEKAKDSILIIGGEFNTLQSEYLLNVIIDKLKHGITVDIFIYDPKPQRKNIEKLIKKGAKVFLTKERLNDHYFVVDGEQFAYHYHKRLDGGYISEGQSVPDTLQNEFKSTLSNAERNAIRLPNSKYLLIISFFIMLALISIAIMTLPFPANTIVSIICLAPILLQAKVIKIY